MKILDGHARRLGGHALSAHGAGPLPIQTPFEDDLSAGTGNWTPGNAAALTNPSGRLRVTNTTAGFGFAVANFACTPGRTYNVSFISYGRGVANARWRLGTSLGNNDIYQSSTTTADGFAWSQNFTGAPIVFISVFCQEATLGQYVEYDNFLVQIV